MPSGRKASAVSGAIVRFGVARTCRHARLHIPIFIIGLLFVAIIWIPGNPYMLAALLWLCVMAGWLPVLLGTARPRRRARRAFRRKSAHELPFITILLPVVNEANMIRQLARAMARLNYPAERLECLVLLEAHDGATPLTALHADWPDFCRLVSVPRGQPHTKARACNYALWQARGDLLVIFDAEDQPHPQQLREAARRFARGRQSLACLQAPLEIIPQENSWLQNQFALEYRILFRFILPCLGRSSGALPLGGSSNYFRLSALRAIGGWDDYNLTEDADIGMRLAQHGYRIDMLVLPTYENAPHHPLIWHGQRTRWHSGHIQTLHVHTQDVSAFRDHTRLALSCAAILLSRLAAAPAQASFIYIAGLHIGADTHNMTAYIWLGMSALIYGAFFVLLYRLSHAATRRQRIWLALTHWFYWLLMLLPMVNAIKRMAAGQLNWLKSNHQPFINKRRG